MPADQKMEVVAMQHLISCFVLAIVLFFSGSGHAQVTDLRRAAEVVANGVGDIGKIKTGDRSRGPVFVFDENHISRAGQIEIAVMLLRLHEKFGLIAIGLEGFIKSNKALDGSWFHGSGGAAAGDARQDVAVRMLAEGEISSSEFMTLIFPSIRVHGIEKRSEYSVDLAIKGAPVSRYLVQIASHLLTQRQIRKTNELVKENKMDDARKYLFSRDPWVKKKFASVNGPAKRSIGLLIRDVRDIQKKAGDLGINIDAATKSDMSALLNFYEMAHTRSKTMVRNALQMGRGNRHAPIAMTIGAAHTDAVLSLLEESKVTYVHIAPKHLEADFGMFSTEQYKALIKRKWARESKGTLGVMLNAHRKPRPKIETASAKSYANLNLAAILIADAMGGNNRIPDDIWREIGSLEGVRIDRGSFEESDGDVIFRAELQDTDENWISVWTRVGQTNSEKTNAELEEKLLQSLADIGAGNKPPRKPPSNSKRAESEGPGDGKRKEVVISRLNSKVVAVFGGTKSVVAQVGKIGA